MINVAILTQQDNFFIPKNISIFNLLSLTKCIGGDLMSSTIKEICNGKHLVKPNKQEKLHYHSWLTINQMNEFILNGGKFI